MNLFVITWSVMAILYAPVPIERNAPQDLYPDEAVEALIAVESCGQSLAMGGSMRGILQMSPIYLKDAGAPQVDAFLPHRAVEILDTMFVRYNVREQGEPEIAIPIFHKGGPGVHKRWRRRIRRGENPHLAAVKAAEDLGIKGMSKFLHKYRAARKGEASWCGPMWKPFRLRPPQS